MRSYTQDQVEIFVVNRVLKYQGMGKDRELLEAAQTGNVVTVEKLLRNKSKSNKFLSG